MSSSNDNSNSGGGGGGGSSSNDNNTDSAGHQVVYQWTPREYREGDPGGVEKDGTGSLASGRRGGHTENTYSAAKGGHHGGGGHHGEANHGQRSSE